ncbi:cyclic nucleotide-gated cation channel beta-1-like [Nerophis ophidion]|uniref:cyclic nucleotide-gated cation channel beta-1-like n=1 Tax=Nerophis ophidion TaxID=159077 RepID=UPI002ADF5CD2|nr:cyclic nucleotide-gated cation channel beta-1-like [Nerophis ophidion]
MMLQQQHKKGEGGMIVAEEGEGTPDNNNHETDERDPEDDEPPQQTHTLATKSNPRTDGWKSVTVAPDMKEKSSVAEDDDVIWALVASYTTLLKKKRQETQILQAQMGGSGKDTPEEEAVEAGAKTLRLGGGAGQAAVASAGHQGELLTKKREDEGSRPDSEDRNGEEAPSAEETDVQPVVHTAEKVEEKGPGEMQDKNEDKEEVEDEEGEDEEEVEKSHEKEEEILGEMQEKKEELLGEMQEENGEGKEDKEKVKQEELTQEIEIEEIIEEFGENDEEEQEDEEIEDEEEVGKAQEIEKEILGEMQEKEEEIHKTSRYSGMEQTEAWAYKTHGGNGEQVETIMDQGCHQTDDTKGRASDLK